MGWKENYTNVSGNTYPSERRSPSGALTYFTLEGSRLPGQPRHRAPCGQFHPRKHKDLILD